MKREGKRERERERERGGGGDRRFIICKIRQGTKTNIVGT